MASSPTTPVYPIASALTVVVEVVGLMLGWIGLRGAFIAFILLSRGMPARDIADELAAATGASFPGAILIGAAATLYLLAS